MSEDANVVKHILPRYNSNIANNRKSTDKNFESFVSSNGGPGADVFGAIPHRISQNKPVDRAGEARDMAGNKSNMPHLSRSRSFREGFGSGGYSMFKDLDSNAMPMFEITPISAGDFKLSGDSANPLPQNEAHKPTLTETITSLGIDALPASGASRRTHISTVLNEFGFGAEPNTNGVPHAPESWNTRPQDTPAASSSRHKQRARSEPAAPRKGMALSDEFSISDNIFTSLRSPLKPETNAPDNLTPPSKLFEGSKTNDQPGQFPESDRAGSSFENPNMYLHTLDSQMISSPDGAQKLKGKRKKAKNRNPECCIPVLTANVDNAIQQASSPEKQAMEDQIRSKGSPKGAPCTDTMADKSTPKSPKKTSPKRESSGTSPRNKPSPRNQASPKSKPQQELGNRCSPPRRTAAGGGGEGSPRSPRGRRDAPDHTRSRSQDSARGRSDRRSPPHKDKSPKCEIKVSQPCHMGRRFYGPCCRPTLKGNIFKNIAQAFGCQLTCIAKHSQRYQGFPGMQGLYTPDIGLESLFNQEPYEVCDDEWDNMPTSSMKAVRSAPRRHGTPAFYSSRRHSSESFRYRGAKGSEKRQRGVSQQAPRGRRHTPGSERQYQTYGRGYLQDDERQLRFELEQASHSSVATVGGKDLESGHSTEPPDEHSLADSKCSVSKSRVHGGRKEALGSGTRLQRSFTQPDKNPDANLSPRSLMSEDDDRSVASRKSGRSTGRRSKQDGQSRRSPEASQRLDMLPQAQVSRQSKKQMSSESENRLQTDSGDSITLSEKQFLDQTRSLLEDSFKGTRVCSRRYPTSERIDTNDDSDSLAVPGSRSMQYEKVVPTEKPMRDRGHEKKRTVVTDEELSLSERKVVPEKRTSFEYRRASKTRLRDKSQEYVLEVSRHPAFKEDNKYVDEKAPGIEERKDVYSVGDRVRDGCAGLYCDSRSEIQGAMNTNVQVYTTLCSRGNASGKAEDCAQVNSAFGRPDYKGSEVMPTKRADWAVEPDSDHSMRQASDSKRYDVRGSQLEDMGSNLPGDAMARGGYSDIGRPHLAGKRSACEVPQRENLLDQTTPEHSASSRYSYDRSGSGQLVLSDDRRSDLEHRKPGQTTNERKRAGHRDNRGTRKEEAKPQAPQSMEREKKRTFTASDEDSLKIHKRVDLSEDCGSRQNQQSTKKERHSSFDRRSRGQEYEAGKTQRPAASEDHPGRRRGLKDKDRPMSLASPTPASVPATDCSSAELTIASCADGRDGDARRRFRRSKEAYENGLRGTQSMAESPYPANRPPTQGYHERPELRRAGEEYPPHGESSKTPRAPDSAQAAECSCPESLDDLNSLRQAEDQRRSSVDSKHSELCRRSKRNYDSAYDDDMDDGVSQEDASTSISRQLLIEEGLVDQFYDQRSHRDEYEETKSLRERPHRAKHLDEDLDRRCHSERLGVRSSSFKYETGKKKGEERSNLAKYSSTEQKGKISGVRVKSTSSRSSHSINSREGEEAREREASLRDSLVTMRENKWGRGSREVRHKQRKLYSSADTRSTTFETGNDSHDDDSEDTLPASPGDLESEYLDEDTDDRARSSKHAQHRTHRASTAEPDFKKIRGRLPPGRQDSQDESHNSSSCRTTPLETYWDKLRAHAPPKGKWAHADESVKKYLEFLTSKSAVAVERDGQNQDQFHSDSCVDRRCLATRGQRNRHRMYCEGSSGSHQTDPQKPTHPGYVHQRSHIRTQSPKFHYYRKKSPQKVEDDDDEEDRENDEDNNGDYGEDDGGDDDEPKGDVVTRKARSRSNSARCANRSRACREGVIDLFEQIIIPEQPLRVDEYRHMHSIRDGVPFFCDSLRVSSQHPQPRGTYSPQSAFSKSISLLSSDGARGPKTNGEPQMYAHTWKSQLNSYTDSLQISSARNTKPVSSSRHSFMQLKSLLLQSSQEKIQIYSHRRARAQSATTTMRPSKTSSHKAQLEVPKDTSSLRCSECPNNDFESETQSTPRTGNAPKDDNTDDLFLSSDVVSWPGNKNFSSNAERDRNSSSGNGDSWHPEYAYRCGVIDTLRILDSDLAMSTPSPEFIHSFQKMHKSSDACLRHHEMEDHWTYIMQTFPSLALCKEDDETFEIIRQNSLRALVYAAKLSVDWPPPNFYDKTAGNLEKWIREVQEYSSGSNISSMAEAYNFDAKTDNEKLRSAHQSANDTKKCHIKSQTVKCAFYPGQSALPKVTFQNVRIDEDNSASPDNRDEVQDSESEQTLQDSETLTEHEQEESSERKGTGTEHSETTSYLSDSDSRAYTEPESSAELALGEDPAGSEQDHPGVNHHTFNWLYKSYKSNAPTHQDRILTQAPEMSYGRNAKTPESCRVTIHKAQLSPIEENRLRAAISRKLGSKHTFALVPVSISESLMSAAEGGRGRPRQSLERNSGRASSCDLMPGGAAKDKDIRDIFDDICQTQPSSPQKTMAFYVVAVDKQRSVDGEARNDVHMGRKQSQMASCTSDGDGTHKKYFIYTKEELIQAVTNYTWEKCDAVRACELPQVHDLPANMANPPNNSNHVSVRKRKQDAMDTTSNVHQIQQSVNTRYEEHAKGVMEVKSSSQVDLQAARTDYTRMNHHPHLHNTTRSQYSTKDQSRPSNTNRQILEKLKNCEDMNPAFRDPTPDAASLDFIKNNHFHDEDTQKSKDVNADHSPFLKSNYNHKIARGSVSHTKEHGDPESFSRHHTVLNNETCFGGQTQEKNTFEYESGLENWRRTHTNKSAKDETCTSEVIGKYDSENLSPSGLADNYKYFEREECIWLTSNDKISNTQSSQASKNRLGTNSKPSEGRESCSTQTSRRVHKNSATNKCSSSTDSSTLAKSCRKSKSSSDLDVSKGPAFEHDGYAKQKKKHEISCQHRTLSLLETLVDGQLVEFFNKALEKIASPKHTICLHVTGGDGKIRTEISLPDPHDTRKDCPSALSSEEDQCMTSRSGASATEIVTEKSLTEESVVILSLPAGTRKRSQRRSRPSPETKKQHSDTIRDWVNNSTAETPGPNPKSDKTKEKYVLSAKRKRLVCKGRGSYRYKRRDARDAQSSESGNITNSANDGNDSETSDTKYQLSPARSGRDWTHRGRNRRLQRRRTPDLDNNHPRGRRASATASRPGRGRDSRQATARSETRYRSLSKSLPAARGKRVKTCSLVTPRKCRIKQKANRKCPSPAKSPKGRKETKPEEVTPGRACEENKEVPERPMTKNVKTFATSGISRLARALNGCHLRERKNVPAYAAEPCDEGRCRQAGPSISEARKHEIKDNKDTQRKEERIPFSDEDSLADCEAFESCLLTPIIEESRSHTESDDKSKSDFEDFVNRCRTKLLGITNDKPYWKNDLTEGRGRTKANCTMSCSNYSCHRSSTSSGNHSSQDESDSCEHRVACCRHGHQEGYGCCHDSEYDFTAGDEAKQNHSQTREYSFSYFQYVVPYKSAFLRRQMQELIKEETPACKNETELLKLYATGNRSEFVNRARGNLTIPWNLRRANVNVNWQQPDQSRLMSEADTPIYTRSVPGVRCPKPRAPSASVSQTRMFSGLYAPYRPRYLANASPQVSDFSDIPRLGATSRHTISGDQARCSKRSSNHWFSSGNDDYHELVHRNWNESANNGSDGSTSGDTSGNEEIDRADGGQHGDYLKRSHLKAKPRAGDAAAGANDRLGNDKASKEPRTGHGKPDHYIKHSQNVSLDDPHFVCREHGCTPYDFVHQNYPVARVSNFAARNINASGNMFGRGLHPGDDRLSSMQDHDGDSDEEFNSATEELPHYSSSCRKRPKYGRKGQEIDDTCNHPESMSYYMGDGPSGQFDNFEGIPKEDLLINLSPVNADDIIYCSHHQKNAACQRPPPSEASGQASAGLNKQGRNECDIHGPVGLGQQMDKNPVLAGRSCYGQGDILNKRVFTQWYVDEGEKAQQSQRRPLVSVAQAEKCPHRERWITPSEQCDSSGDDGEEEDDDDEENDCEDDDDDGEENEEDEDDGEEVEEDDDDEDDEDEEEDDEDNEEEDEEEDEEDDNNGVPGHDLCEDERNLKQKTGGVDQMKEKNAQNNYHHEKPQDINESKIVGRRIADTDQLSKRPTRVRTLTHTKRYATGHKPGHQQSTGDHLTKPKPAGLHEKNMHIKPTGGHQHKFSLEQIKVPAIEKERVRFACDENGDWAEIGRGSYGCVYLGLLDGVVEVAIKDFYESSSWDLVIHEARMLMFLQDTGITPKFYGLRRRFDVSKQPSEYCIIMEYFGDGRTLFNVMSDKMVLAGDEWMDIVGQLVAGLRLIHRKNVLINDLKADNILIDLTGGRKIIRYIDVGMATYKQGLTFQLPQDQMSKYNFLAPEVREGARTTTRSDIYSLGYMLEQMCRMADSTLGGLRKLVARCMEKNPARRPDIDDIVSQVHRFIAAKASILINSSSPREQFVLTNSV